jgi:hypothetical protein
MVGAASSGRGLAACGSPRIRRLSARRGRCRPSRSRPPPPCACRRVPCQTARGRTQHECRSSGCCAMAASAAVRACRPRAAPRRVLRLARARACTAPRFACAEAWHHCGDHRSRRPRVTRRAAPLAARRRRRASRGGATVPACGARGRCCWRLASAAGRCMVPRSWRAPQAPPAPSPAALRRGTAPVQPHAAGAAPPVRAGADERAGQGAAR